MKPLCHNNKTSTVHQRVYTRNYDIARKTQAPTVSADAKRKTMIRRKIEIIQEKRALKKELSL